MLLSKFEYHMFTDSLTGTLEPAPHECDWLCLTVSVTGEPAFRECDWSCLTVNVSGICAPRVCWFRLTVSVTAEPALHEWLTLPHRECNCWSWAPRVWLILPHRECNSGTGTPRVSLPHPECNNDTDIQGVRPWVSFIVSVTMMGYWSCMTVRASTSRDVTLPLRGHESDCHRVALVCLIISYFACNRRSASVTMSLLCWQCKSVTLTLTHSGIVAQRYWHLEESWQWVTLILPLCDSDTDCTLLWA
jgi:hypothetical protein